MRIVRQKGHIPILVVVVITSVVSIVAYSFIQTFKSPNNLDKSAVILDSEEKIIDDSLEEGEKMDVSDIVLEKEPPEETKEKETLVIEEDIVLKSEIKLTYEKKDTGIHLYWSVQNVDTSGGFKIVKSLENNPTFPEDGYIYVDDSSVRNYFLGLKDGKKWFIRVCSYNGAGSCSNYSNEISFIAPQVSDGKSSNSDSDVERLKLIVTKKSDSKVKLTWEVDGKSDKGFKVVWSKNAKPTYPTRAGDKFHYLNKSDARSDYVDDLSSGKTYYFRVCEYLDGKCGTYSNEESIKL
ncbi:hypothetical protein ACFL0C_00365 [Patescibacteria group bacterium]